MPTTVYWADWSQERRKVEANTWEAIRIDMVEDPQYMAAWLHDHPGSTQEDFWIDCGGVGFDPTRYYKELGIER